MDLRFSLPHHPSCSGKWFSYDYFFKAPRLMKHINQYHALVLSGFRGHCDTLMMSIENYIEELARNQYHSLGFIGVRWFKMYMNILY